jgi:hypothetical protein
MSTIRYDDFIKKFDEHNFVESDSFGVALLSEDYKPKETDKYNAIGKYIISTTVNALAWGQFSTLVMSDIIDLHLHPEIKKYIKANNQSIEARLNVTHKDKPEKLEKLKEKFMRFGTDEVGNDFQDWQDLKENGVKWMVTYFVKNKSLLLGWAEEL